MSRKKHRSTGKPIHSIAKDLDFLLLDSTFFCYGKNYHSQHRHFENLEYQDFLLDSVKKIGNLYVSKSIFLELKKSLHNFDHKISAARYNNSKQKHRSSSKQKRQASIPSSYSNELQKIIYKEHKMLDELSGRHRVLKPTSEMKELSIRFKDEIETIPDKKHALSEPDIGLLTNALYLAEDNACGMLSNDKALETVAINIALDNEEFDLKTYFQNGDNSFRLKYKM